MLTCQSSKLLHQNTVWPPGKLEETQLPTASSHPVGVQPLLLKTYFYIQFREDEEVKKGHSFKKKCPNTLDDKHQLYLHDFHHEHLSFQQGAPLSQREVRTLGTSREAWLLNLGLAHYSERVTKRGSL